MELERVFVGLATDYNSFFSDILFPSCLGTTRQDNILWLNGPYLGLVNDDDDDEIKTIDLCCVWTGLLCRNEIQKEKEKIFCCTDGFLEFAKRTERVVFF